jgi:glucose/arabinose dehydrogenase
MRISSFVFVLACAAANAQSPRLVDNNLQVGAVISGLTTPISMAFIGPNDFLVLEKNTGMVKRVTNGAMQSVALDLAVNNASERGLLGIALHPDFPTKPWVYLYWTCIAPPPADPFLQTQDTCSAPAFGTDTDDILSVPIRGNRVDRFVWNGSTLTFDRNLISLRSFQNDGGPNPPNQGDAAQPPRGNHDGGVIRFGPDKKLYIIIGDQGRRGLLQNLQFGPTPPEADDQYGGPLPDNAHLTGVVLRLNDDGTTPRDNPFFAVGAVLGGEPSGNVQRVFAYGVRNSFGMAFDPKSGALWNQENADDAFDEINLVEAGANHGWVQTMGPISRQAQFKDIENTITPVALQQLRWPPSNLADTEDEAASRLFMLPGAHYSDPEFSWKYAVAPAGLGFINGRGLGPQYDGDMLVGAATPALLGGYLFRFQLTGNRRQIAVDDPRLNDRVADNTAKFNITESESLVFGSNFGIGTDIQTGPDGNVYVVSLSHGTVYRISRR